MGYRQGYELIAYRRAGSTSMVPQVDWVEKSVESTTRLPCQNSLLPYRERCGASYRGTLAVHG